MSDSEEWYYKEVQIGKDYDTLEEVEVYDTRHRKFRDVDKENDAIIAALNLSSDDTVIEFGTGTGAFAIRAAGRCRQVHAVDISRIMLAYAQNKAKSLGLENIAFHNAGFLTYQHDASPADAAVTSLALHHLPDFWKAAALKRINAMLKPGARFYLADVIFTPDNTQENINRWIQTLSQTANPALRADIEAHISREYSTFDWIIDGLLERSGFEIKKKEMIDGVIGRYLCVKRGT